MRTSDTLPEDCEDDEAGRRAALAALKHAIGLARLWAGDDEVSLLLRRTLREMNREHASPQAGEIH